ncbi:unnamed protein product [Notodromas monacha]|uniref:Uncharacterized protein n=1 Tax=Notodromas monacha TaxID=399045 RepID=A0A7R9GF51_9CRUS|nr:unnamed protein product [Notodromas monacha]CAG0918756.1 unnamed protein product [Notodromas monacha]
MHCSDATDGNDGVDSEKRRKPKLHGNSDTHCTRNTLDQVRRRRFLQKFSPQTTTRWKARVTPPETTFNTLLIPSNEGSLSRNSCLALLSSDESFFGVRRSREASPSSSSSSNTFPQREKNKIIQHQPDGYKQGSWVLTWSSSCLARASSWAFSTRALTNTSAFSLSTGSASSKSLNFSLANSKCSLDTWSSDQLRLGTNSGTSSSSSSSTSRLCLPANSSLGGAAAMPSPEGGSARTAAGSSTSTNVIRLRSFGRPAPAGNRHVGGGVRGDSILPPPPPPPAPTMTVVVDAGRDCCFTSLRFPCACPSSASINASQRKTQRALFKFYHQQTLHACPEQVCLGTAVEEARVSLASLRPLSSARLKRAEFAKLADIGIKLHAKQTTKQQQQERKGNICDKASSYKKKKRNLVQQEVPWSPFSPLKGKGVPVCAVGDKEMGEQAVVHKPFILNKQHSTDLCAKAGRQGPFMKNCEKLVLLFLVSVLLVRAQETDLFADSTLRDT